MGKLGLFRALAALRFWGLSGARAVRSQPQLPPSLHTEERIVDQIKPPCGLSEADENNFRVLLSKIREHDPEYLSFLLVTCARQTQPPNSVIYHMTTDRDDILTDLVVVARGTRASARLLALYKNDEAANDG